MKPQSLALLLVSLCAVSAALATTYVRVEKDGTKTYSDRPIPGGQPVELQPAQTYSTPPPTVATPSSQRPREEQLLLQADDFRYESCPSTPENDTTLQTPSSVTITVSTNPPLRPRDVVTISVDGQAVGQNTLSYTMSPVYRGSHSVGVSVANTYGTVVCSSSSVFHVQQPSLNSPARRPIARPR